MAPRTMWIDASAGVAGDMLLGALVDAGAPLDDLQQAVDAVVPGAVRLTRASVTRAGLRATKVDVEVLVEDPPHRTWRTIRDMLTAADLAAPVRATALAAFARLAEAEGQVHGVPADEVHFHEVGALDAIADVVGTAAGVHALGADHVLVSAVALGSGTVRAHHGVLPVPVPAVLELSRGWEVLARGEGELATPTGMALVTALAHSSSTLPPLRVEASGIGAGSRDTPGRANVVRVVLGAPVANPPAPADGTTTMVQLEANVDDLDPRVWPEVLAHLLGAGAADAWLVPILMKKGRPAHTLAVLTTPDLAEHLTTLVLRHTSTLGVRSTPTTRTALGRSWVEVHLDDDEPADRAADRTVDGAGGPRTVRIKLGHRDGALLQVMPEFDDVRAVAAATGEPVHVVLARARARADRVGLVPGAPWPPDPAP